MRCADIECDLRAYADGMLSRWKSLAVATHLARCEHCRERHSAMVSAESGLSKAMKEPVDTPDIAGSVMELIGAETAPMSVRPRRIWVGAFAAASAAAVIVAMVYLPGRMPHAPVPNRIADIGKPGPSQQPKSIPPKAPNSPEKPDLRPTPKTKPDTMHRPIRERHTAPRRFPLRRYFAANPLPTSPAANAHETTAVDPEPAAPRSYVVVVTEYEVPSVAVVETRDAATGSVTRCYSARNRDGSQATMRITYTPSTPRTEEPTI